MLPRRASLSVILLAVATTAAGQDLTTPAEKKDFKATSRNQEVVDYCTALAKQFPSVHFTDFGSSHEGNKLPLLILSDPPLASPEEAAKTQKPVVLAFANIHAGEVDGKEAVLALARDLAGKDQELLKKLVILLVPNLNPDGNDRISDRNRTSQSGPVGVGTRQNAQGLDLNRDFVKLESPEIRALVRLVDRWNPLLVIDCHTTNGSFHRYTLTYDGPRHPAAEPRLIEMAQGTVLPDVAKRIKAATGFDTFPYGNFSRDRTRWETYPAQPRYGIQYFGIRGTLALLSESYSYASFPDRVKASYAFVRSAFGHVADHTEEWKAVAKEAARPRKRVALRTQTVPQGSELAVAGFVEKVEGKRRVRTDEPKDYQLKLVTRVEPTLEVEIPAAYVILPGFDSAVETLQRHGIQVEELREDVRVDARGYIVTEARQEKGNFQRPASVTFEVKPAAGPDMAPAGGVLVRTDQPLGVLAAYLLEPQAEDGLAAWNFFAKGVAQGKLFPVIRLAAVPDAQTGTAVQPPETRPARRPITLEVYLSGGRGQGGGRGFGDSVDWLPDGEHYLQARRGRLLKVHARTGKSEPFFDPANLRASLSTLKDLTPRAIDQLLRQPSFRMDPDRTGTLVNVGGDVAFAFFDGKPAVRLTNSPAGKEFLTLSPDGKRVAFVRGGNLFTASLDGGEKQLTTDGGGVILNGKADWVYEEEIFNRNGRAYWWSPDGSQIAFMRFDDSPVTKFPITHSFPARSNLETVQYPKAGDPNPLVTIGVVPTAGGPVQFLDLSDYPPDDLVISRVGWVADSKVPFAYIQNREQTWLDFVTWPDPEGKPVKLFRDQTKAWIENVGEPHYLKDGTFLYLSERSGFQHLYHYAADGKLIRQVTDGEWEVDGFLRADEEGGWVYFNGDKDGSTATHFYRVRLDGSELERLTPPGGTHRVSLAPMGGLFVDRFSDDTTPPQAALHEIGKGKVRTLDSNPGRELDQYILGKYERVTVPMKDGFVLEGAIVYPPDFDEKKTYPIWILTYAGPHAPTVRTGYSTRMFEQVLAQSGIVVFRVDPRPASGKGAQSAWTAYKQLGVQELKDLEEAVDWICKNPWADAKRVGISGHSYGGYMTAYAMTHSTKFAAGIAGAPVTDWRLYDTIYTERYMSTPQKNKEGYEKSSVVAAAKNLHGKLLLAHGMIDDNVHLQNTAQFIDALQRANKDFEVMFYPRSRHGIGGPHYQRLQVTFIRRALGVEVPVTEAGEPSPKALRR